MIGYFIREQRDAHGHYGWEVMQLKKRPPRRDNGGTMTDGFDLVWCGAHSRIGYERDVAKRSALFQAKRLAKEAGVPFLGILSGGDLGND